MFICCAYYNYIHITYIAHIHMYIYIFTGL